MLGSDFISLCRPYLNFSELPIYYKYLFTAVSTLVTDMRLLR